ncbi:hypothetical protein, partial [Methylobacterium frigidaeris]|uniref:hypothetical protein n=1 Tax=Methylobacterium frigidaeris TaxID=2038277 RepID=UPI0013FE2AEE
LSFYLHVKDLEEHSEIVNIETNAEIDENIKPNINKNKEKILKKYLNILKAMERTKNIGFGNGSIG